MKILFLKNKNLLWNIFLFSIFILSCGAPQPVKEEEKKEAKNTSPLENFLTNVKNTTANQDLFQYSLQPATLNFNLPALQSFASAMYNGYWILIGGSEIGFHGTTSYPPPFASTGANDSIWIVNLQNSTVMGVPTPLIYSNFLSATNQQFYQVGNYLYLCGGFTKQYSSNTQYNWTSDRFFEIYLPSLVQYVQSGGASPPLSQVFTKVIQNPFVQVTGGSMIVANNNYYIVGGQNYQGTYTSGNTGTYTNAIRKFNLAYVQNQWTISNTSSVIDAVNLHRRDLNLVPVIAHGNDSLRAVIYGGVFTSSGSAYLNPVYISGLVNGTPVIKVDTMQQKVNQYNCASVSIAANNVMFLYNQSALLGGISYMKYDTATQQLVIGDNGMPMPFSNLISSMYTDGQNFSTEDDQLPPQYMLPAYIGSDATFFPLTQYLMNGYTDILDIDKIFSGSNMPPIFIGYMYGGILSEAATTVSVNGHFNTYANPVLYKVFISLP